MRLADRTLDLLRDNDQTNALLLVRAASAKMDCVVSWNHLLDYGISQGKVNATMKLYNEVGLSSDIHRITETDHLTLDQLILCR